MSILGESDIILKTDSASTKTRALVSGEMKHTVLVSWHDLQKLKIIPEDFPAISATVRTGFDQVRSKIIADFPSVFSEKLNPTPMSGPKMHIFLKDNPVPYRISAARQVPLRFQEESDLTVADLIQSQIIEKSDEPTDWCSPAFFVPKADGKRVRLVTDFTRLNKYVRRPVHPFPSVMDILKAIPASATCYAKCDATHGYFQVALDEESSKLTTFLLPSGRYRYLRAPMGLSSSSDEWCRHSDRAVEGLPWSRKIVDDILIWASSVSELEQRIRTVADRCANIGLTLSPKKFQMGTELEFAGCVIGRGGVRPDPDRLRAISQFPEPHDQTSLRSFLGLANQLAFFVPDFAHLTASLRQLTGKGKQFLWLPEHHEEFIRLRKLLSGHLVVHHYDSSLPVTLLTDASRLHGLGYALGHEVKGQFKLVMCGSKSLTPTQQRYSTIELECLGIAWAIEKCSFYLKGHPGFLVATDHRPLVGVFSKDIYDLPNPRLQRLRERLAQYAFTVKWVPGKTHLIADALSRAPLFVPEDDNLMEVDSAMTCLTSTRDKSLSIIEQGVDEDYRKMILDVLNDTSTSSYVKQLKNLAGHLSVEHGIVLLDAKRIVVPVPAVKEILKRLHFSHSGYTKTYEYARQMYYWPGMCNDIKQMVTSCKFCPDFLPSQQKNPMVTKPPSAYLGPPMDQVGLDLFDCAGKKYLICVDQWSGFPIFTRLGSLTTSAVIKHLESWFNVLGWPRVIRSDGGPQFGPQFSAFCSANSIEHNLSSPYNPKSNGLAESGVKIVKHLMQKCQSSGEDLPRALYEWRNCPRSDGFSPAQLFFGRRQVTSLPALERQYQPVNFQSAAAARDSCHSKMKDMHDQHKKFLPGLSPGQPVFVQDSSTGKWSKTGFVVKARPDQLSYLVNVDGRQMLRARSMLRPTQDQITGGVSSTAKANLVRSDASMFQYLHPNVDLTLSPEDLHLSTVWENPPPSLLRHRQPRTTPAASTSRATGSLWSISTGPALAPASGSSSWSSWHSPAAASASSSEGGQARRPTGGTGSSYVPSPREADRPPSQDPRISRDPRLNRRIPSPDRRGPAGPLGSGRPWVGPSPLRRQHRPPYTRQSGTPDIPQPSCRRPREPRPSPNHPATRRSSPRAPPSRPGTSRESSAGLQSPSLLRSSTTIVRKTTLTRKSSSKIFSPLPRPGRHAGSSPPPLAAPPIRPAVSVEEFQRQRSQQPGNIHNMRTYF